MLEIAIDLARQAGALLRRGHENGAGTVANKSSGVDLVTEFDLASERLIADGLRRHFPHHAIHGEETGGELPTAGPVWVIDPLDGTTNFAHGYPVFSVTLALLIDGQPELGVTYDPLREELFWAQAGRGAWRGEQRLHVSATGELRASLLATGFAYDRASNPDNNLAEFSHFMPRTRGVRRAGSAALDIAWVAAGQLDGYWERGIQLWDMAAGVLLVREAGGVVTTYSGQPWRPGHRNVAAANSVLHQELLHGLQTARCALPVLPD
ncbi:MAG: inositol monophosphatase [Anaerolinea sp.]|nr:inositol monophosphatase [Anaerolinea sp.]